MSNLTSWNSYWVRQVHCQLDLWDHCQQVPVPNLHPHPFHILGTRWVRPLGSQDWTPPPPHSHHQHRQKVVETRVVLVAVEEVASIVAWVAMPAEGRHHSLPRRHYHRHRHTQH